MNIYSRIMALLPFALLGGIVATVSYLAFAIWFFGGDMFACAATISSEMFSLFSELPEAWDKIVSALDSNP